MQHKFNTIFGFVFTGSLLVTCVLLVLTSTIVVAAPLNDYRHNNITFMNPDWVMYPQTDAVIVARINKMKTFQIKYQMIDVGFFDHYRGTTTFDDQKGGAIDGSMDPAAYAQLVNWVQKCRKYDPEMKLIASVNGNRNLHIQAKAYTAHNGATHIPAIDKTAMHAKIAAHCKYLVKTFDLDGINLDFEPITAGSPSADYRLLIKAVREAIGSSKHLSLCGNPFETIMPDTELQQYAPLLNMIVIMDYDTADQGMSPYPDDDYTTNATNYQLETKENVIRLSKVLSPTGCELIPLGPGKYHNTTWHPSYENAMNHSIAINDAIAEGAVVAGSGMWWFDGASNDVDETNWFLKYWVNVSK